MMNDNKLKLIYDRWISNSILNSILYKKILDSNNRCKEEKLRFQVESLELSLTHTYNQLEIESKYYSQIGAKIILAQNISNNKVYLYLKYRDRVYGSRYINKELNEIYEVIEVGFE